MYTGVRLRWWVPLVFALPWGSFPVQAGSGFELPGGVYRIENLDEAKAAARSKRLPLTFVISDEDTTCPKARAATRDAFRELGRKTVPVYVGPSGQQRLPRVVVTAAHSSEAGQYIPITVVVDSGLNRVIAIVPYAAQVEREGLLLKARRAIDKFSEENQAAAPAASDPKPGAPAAGGGMMTTDPVVTLRWQGSPNPAPAESLPRLIKEMGYEFQELSRKPGECRIKINATVFSQAFQTRLKDFLSLRYRLDSYSVSGAETTVVLGASE